MPYFKKDDLNVLFIHIPKTGGTSVEFYFSSKYDIPLYNKSLFYFIQDEEWILANKEMNIKSSLQHITYNHMVKFNSLFQIQFDNIMIITIVRNPYERIISDLFFLKLITIDTTPDMVLTIINDYVDSDNYDNHNLPQYTFITNDREEIIENIHILKTEHLTEDMVRLGFCDFNIYRNVNDKKVDYYQYLNKESIKKINHFYNLDFKLFHYDML